MKHHYPALIGTIFFFISTTAVAHDDDRLKVIEAQLQEQQSKIGTLLETVASQEEVIGKLHKTVVPNIQPVGSIIFTASETAPAGYLYCDGSALSRTEYSELFATIGTTWGKGDGSATFNLPDMRGEFVRVWSKGHSVDSGRKLGQLQGQATAMPANQFSAVANGGHNHAMTASGTQATGSAGNHAHTENALGGHKHNLAEVVKGSCSPPQVCRNTDGHGHILVEPICEPEERPDPENVCHSQYEKIGYHVSYTKVTAKGAKSSPARERAAAPVTTAIGDHTHTIAANGAHTHTGPSHTHPLAAVPNHPHTITGGDAETRPRNQALSCFIKAFSNSAF